MRQGIMAMESIAFQGNALFEELTAAADSLRGFGNTLEDRAYWNTPEVMAISQAIFKHTGIAFMLLDGEGPGLSIMAPALGHNSVLWSQEVKDRAERYMHVDLASDARFLMDCMQTPLITGQVDLRKGRVSGAYSKLTLIMLVPRSILAGDSPFTPEEVAALILHETGHGYTSMEFISRSVSTNQVLAGLVRSLDNTVPATTRRMVYAKGAHLLRMTEEQQLALYNAKNKAELTLVVVDAAIKESVSELGRSVYDSVSAEYLSDEFATRCGAGRALVTAMDKYNRTKWSPLKESSSWMIDCLSIVGVVAGNVLTLGAPWLTLVFMQDKQSNAYDKDKHRFLRIKMQNIQRLKDTSISQLEKRTLIESNETIDTVCQFCDDNLTFIEKAAYYLRPSYRAAHKFELLQKDLEKIGFSDLFTHAAKLSTL